MKVERLITFCLFFFFILLEFEGYTQFDWPMHNANKERTSCILNEEELFPPFRDTSLIWIWTEDLAFYDSKIYYGANGGPNKIAAFDYLEKDHLWFYDVDNSFGSIGFVPPVSEDMVLGGGQGCTGLHGINRQNGEKVWFRKMEPIYYRSPIIEEDRVYIANDSLYCLELLTGKTIWSKPLNVYFPVIDEQNIYVGHNSFLFVFDKITGDLIWERQGHYYYGTVNQNAFFTAGPDKIECINKTDGTTIWEYLPSDVYSFGNGIALNDKYLVYTVWANLDNKARIIVLDIKDGKEVWNYLFDVEGCYSPTIANGVVYTCGWVGGKLWGFDIENGDVLYEDDARHYYGQPVIANHSLFVQSVDGLIEFNMNETSATLYREPGNTPSVYPNPSYDKIIIKKVNNPLKCKKAVIYDFHGKKLKDWGLTTDQKQNEIIELDISDLKAGIFLLYLINDQTKSIHKIIKLE